MYADNLDNKIFFLQTYYSFWIFLQFSWRKKVANIVELLQWGSTHTQQRNMRRNNFLIQKRNLDTIFAYTINCFLYRANITFYFRIRAVKRKFLLCAWIIIFYQLARSKIVYYILVILQGYTPSNFRHEPLWYCPLTYCKMH